ncbi:MAG TPA: ABC transporter ATP-binding protein [Patescibacteria group bacterium]|nr:ABC transporter ATP-binding protein [Patescibacteria group bacterium]
MTPIPYDMREVLLSINHVSHSFQDRVVLRDVNGVIRNVHRDHINQGQVVALLGPSGLGKTTLLHVLAGLLRPSSGQVLITEAQRPIKRGEVGVVTQECRLFQHRTVRQNLYLAARLAKMSRDDAKNKTAYYLDLFHMTAHAEAYPVQLSGGQRQRVAIAQQLLCSSYFLLMDEPFSGLDVNVKEEVCQLITEVAQLDELKTIIVVTHDTRAAIQVADTIWLLGRDRTPAGEIIPGARIMDEIDLKARGLAWQPNLKQLPEFETCVREIEARFKNL